MGNIVLYNNYQITNTPLFSLFIIPLGVSVIILLMSYKVDVQ